MQGIGLFKTDAHDVACLQDELNHDHILNGGPLHCHDLLDQVCAVDHRRFFQIFAGVRKGCGVHDGCPAGTLPDAADDVDGAERFRQRHEVDAGVKQAVHRTGDTQQHTDDTAQHDDFDDSQEASYFVPRLTSIHIHEQIMGYTAANLLMTRIEEPSLNYRTVYTETNLILRESTGD